MELTMSAAIHKPGAGLSARNSRFARNYLRDLETQKAQSAQNITLFKDSPLSDSRKVCKKTEDERVRLGNAWAFYFRETHGIDSDDIFIQICEGVDNTWLIRDFFISYVNNSIRERPRLRLADEDVESESVRGINSAITVKGMWKTLMGMAEAGVLQRKRKEDPSKASQWTTRITQRSVGPIYKISKWIESEAADVLGLTRQQTFEKKEMTPEDIMILLGTFWKQAEHITCSPKTRLAFHTAIVIAGIGGFRPGEILNLKYKQVAFELVRDPNEPTKLRFVANITIRHNKGATKVIESNQSKVLSFSVTAIPCKPICLVSLLVARAIADQAFQTEFSSIEELCARARLEHTDSLQLRWKPGMENKEIVPINYASYLDLWHRTLLVAGLRDDEQRPYSLRVGAGGRMSGSLEEPVRNYVMGNTKDVFLLSYQPRHVREDLLQTAFGVGRTGNNSALFDSLRGSFRQRDPNAPIYPRKSDMDALEDRQDVRDLRAAYSDAVARGSSKDPEAKKIAARLHYVRHILADSLLKQLRKEYFEDVDRRRAMGELTLKAADHGVNPFKTFDPEGARAAAAIGHYMQTEDDSAEQVSSRLLDLYVAHVQRRPAGVHALLGGNAQPPERSHSGGKHRCLFGCGSFTNRGNLTKHNTGHYNQGYFDHPFPCPECQQLGNKAHMISGPIEWSNHVETVHGEDHAPNLPKTLRLRRYAPRMDDLSSCDRGPCLVCGSLFKNAGAFMRHFKINHVQKQQLFEAPFDCPECLRQKSKHIRVKNEPDWQMHLANVHGGGGPYGALHSLREPKRKSCQVKTNRVEEPSNKRRKTGCNLDTKDPARAPMRTRLSIATADDGLEFTDEGVTCADGPEGLLSIGDSVCPPLETSTADDGLEGPGEGVTTHPYADCAEAHLSTSKHGYRSEFEGSGRILRSPRLDWSSIDPQILGFDEQNAWATD
ncbi:hypothetical protein F5Y15DRAFT_45409 [Xylariaceae sp. FL0016]|nr:hypothetical protein F5Y15DRAFT_45409 [Xylariaceae sp. FL0016]